MIKLITKSRYYKILGKEIYKDYVKYSKVVFPEIVFIICLSTANLLGIAKPLS